jgi:hypothetical protein
MADKLMFDVVRAPISVVRNWSFRWDLSCGTHYRTNPSLSGTFSYPCHFLFIVWFLVASLMIYVLDLRASCRTSRGVPAYKGLLSREIKNVAPNVYLVSSLRKGHLLCSFTPPGTSPQNEDCLKINVWTGASEKTEKRLVML